MSTTSLAPRRHIQIDGLLNLRDVGGYATRDGRRTRWRMLFRSDFPGNLADEPRAHLLAHGIRTVVDLRRDREEQRRPNVLASSAGVRYVRVSLVEKGPEQDTGDPRAVDTRSLGEIYRHILEERHDQLRTALAPLLAEDGLPALVHCVAGKDRTGVIVALLLGAVGVADETILEDYALSDTCLGEDWLRASQVWAEEHGVDWARLQPHLVCDLPGMQAFLERLETRFGGAAAYLRRLGFSEAHLAGLRERLTEPAD